MSGFRDLSESNKNGLHIYFDCNFLRFMIHTLTLSCPCNCMVTCLHHDTVGEGKVERVMTGHPIVSLHFCIETLWGWSGGGEDGERYT